MSFLDNIENDLKALEARQERDPAQAKREQDRRKQERELAAESAVHADALRQSKFTSDLLDHAVRIGHALRTKVYMTWIDSALRLQARDRKLELHPTRDGVVARSFEGENKVGERVVDLAKENPRELAEEWLQGLGQRPPE